MARCFLPTSGSLPSFPALPLIRLVNIYWASSVYWIRTGHQGSSGDLDLVPGLEELLVQQGWDLQQTRGQEL